MTLLFFVHLCILVSIHKQCYLSLVCQSRFYETILTDLKIVMPKTKHQGHIVLPPSVPVQGHIVLPPSVPVHVLSS